MGDREGNISAAFQIGDVFWVSCGWKCGGGDNGRVLNKDEGIGRVTVCSRPEIFIRVSISDVKE